MGLDYLKITPEIMTKISAYDQEQQGRLMLAMIAYALDGVEPEFDGMEKFVWPTLKMDIDRCAASVEKQSANGSKGGRPGKSQTKPTETQKNPEKPTKTQPKANESLNTNTNTNNKKEDVVDTRATAADEEDGVIGIDGTDLSAEIQINAEVDTILRTYKLPEAVRGDLLDDIAAHGLEKVKRTRFVPPAPEEVQAYFLENGSTHIQAVRFKAYYDSNGWKVGKNSMKDWKAAARNWIDRDKNGFAGQTKAAPSQDKMLRYSEKERKETYSAAVLDFD